MDVKCELCGGEGEKNGLLCPNCRGAGVVVLANKKTARAEMYKPNSYVSPKLYKNEAEINPDTDKIVVVGYNAEGRDVSHWLCGSVLDAQAHYEVKLQQSASVDLLTVVEYFEKFGNFKSLPRMKLFEDVARRYEENKSKESN
jgi:hypothetical protein